MQILTASSLPFFFLFLPEINPSPYSVLLCGGSYSTTSTRILSITWDSTGRSE